MKQISKPSLSDEIVGNDVLVKVLGGKKVPYIFFDNAASTPVFKETLDLVNRFMPWYSSVHRGSGLKSLISTNAYDNARNIVGKFFNANPKEHTVIFGKNTTEAVNKLSYRLGLSKKDVVLIGMMEHHSNDLPWRRCAEVHRISIDEQGDLVMAHLDQLLKKYKQRVKLVAISGGSNVSGSITDISLVAKKAHQAGAQIFVDCAQLAPHREIDIKELSDPEHLDYIAISAHKLYAPFGVGALIGRADTFSAGEPEVSGGGTIKVVTESDIEWADGPDRDEAGSPNVVGAIALAKSLQVLSGITMKEIADHEAKLTNYSLEKMSVISGITIYGSSDPLKASHRLGVIPFNMKGISDSLLAAILSTEWGIGVRNGCFCAHPYVTHLLGMTPKDIAKFKAEMINNDRRYVPGVVRVSFGVYNNQAEVDRLITALNKIALGSYSKSYIQDKYTGAYTLSGWNPTQPTFL